MITEYTTLSSRAVTDATWDSFVENQPAGHLLQMSGWAALKARFGWQAERMTLADETGAVCAGAELLFRRVAGLTLAYVPRGPVTPWEDRELTQALLAELAQRARMRGAVLLKLEPNLPDTPENRARLTELGFRPSRQDVQPPSTILLDLTRSEDEILNGMKSKWRYNVRLAGRKGVTVRTLARDEMHIFNELMAVTGARDGFSVHGPDYYAAAYDLLAREHGVFLLAEYAGQPLASIAVFAVGKTAWYLWGASNNQERNRMPNHALQWAAIQWAKGRGATCYDFWGIPDEIGKLAQSISARTNGSEPPPALPLDLNQLPNHGLWGVYRFKQGFGGREVRYVGAWDKPLHPVGYRAYAAGLALRGQPARLRQTDPVRVALAPVSRPAPAGDTTLRVVTRRNEWRTALAGLPDPHVLQSWEWGEVKEAANWHAERLLLPGAQGAPEAALQFLWRRPVDNLPLRIAYVPKGPVVNWHDPDVVERVLTQIEARAHARNCLFVKIDPDVREDSRAGKRLIHALFRRGWRYSNDQTQFKNTAYSDLALTEEDLLAGMKSKWRYNIRLAGRRGITVRLGHGDDLPAFYDLYAETGTRDGFLIRPFSYYRTAWKIFLAAQQDEANPAGGALLLAEHPKEDAPVAAVFLMRYGARSWYIYGASSDRRRRDMPNSLLQWEAMRWSREQGCTLYDWWGAPTDPDDPDDGMQGVWQFKQGFGAEFQPHIGAWDYAVSPLLYSAYARAMPAVLGVMRMRNEE